MSGTSPGDWNTKLTQRSRYSVSARSLRLPSSAPSMTTEPESARSRPPRIPRSVVLPDPERPTRATSSPSSTERLTSRRAATLPAGVENERLTLSQRTASGIAVLDDHAQPLAMDADQPAQARLLDQVAGQLEATGAFQDHQLAGGL